MFNYNLRSVFTRISNQTANFRSETWDKILKLGRDHKLATGGEKPDLKRSGFFVAPFGSKYALRAYNANGSVMTQAPKICITQSRKDTKKKIFERLNLCIFAAFRDNILTLLVVLNLRQISV